MYAAFTFLNKLDLELKHFDSLKNQVESLSDVPTL